MNKNKRERKTRENLVVDCLDKLEIFKLEFQMHQNNPKFSNLFTLFPQMGSSG